jgi:S-adenosylmethionine:tRNA ribosyltransferase-isomerase
MNVDDFDFELPADLIALRPARPRDSARLLVVRGPEGLIEDRSIRDLPGLLKAGDTLVANNSLVLRAALSGSRPARAEGGEAVKFEANLHRQVAPDAWDAFVRPGKRLKPGDRVDLGAGLTAVIEAKHEDGSVRFRFPVAGAALNAAIEAAGAPPLPPYIVAKRGVDEQDTADYQTVFASEAGSVAAPTAGLHFTPALMEAITQAGVAWEQVTLHVSAGTFLPMKTERIEDHRMHSERAILDDDTAMRIRAARAAEGRCIPVGTTALRTLESAARGGALEAFDGDTDIFISPGYRFAAADGLITNFHLPKSTLFVLVSAMMGLDVMKRAYAHAVAERYRFYSYGDACLLLPNG